MQIFGPLSGTLMCSCGEMRPRPCERPSQTLPWVSAGCASYRQHSQPDALDTKDTSIRAIMLLQLSRLKPSVFRSLSAGRHKAETQRATHKDRMTSLYFPTCKMLWGKNLQVNFTSNISEVILKNYYLDFTKSICWDASP